MSRERVGRGGDSPAPSASHWEPNYIPSRAVSPSTAGSEDETTVNDSYSITVPASVRRAADIEAGDKLRWRVEESGEISVEVVKQRHGAFADLTPIETEEETHAAVDHDLVAGER